MRSQYLVRMEIAEFAVMDCSAPAIPNVEKIAIAGSLHL